MPASPSSASSRRWCRRSRSPGDTADTPTCRAIASCRRGYFSSRSGDRIARVSWNRNDLFALTAALGDEHQVELVGVVLAGRRHDVELHRQVVAGVHLLEHRQRRHLRIAQIGLGVGAMHAPATAPPPRRRPPRRAGPSCRTRSPCRCPGTSAARRRPRCWRSSADRAPRTGRSPLASGSSRIARNCARCPGRSRCDTSRNAWNASSLSASGAMRSTVWPSQVAVRTPSIGSCFHARAIRPQRKHRRIEESRTAAASGRSSACSPSG